MSLHEFDDACQDCKPAIVDVQTRKVMPDDAPTMQVVMRLWSETTLAERQAWHHVTCQNSQDPEDLRHAQVFAQRVERALKAS